MSSLADPLPALTSVSNGREKVCSKTVLAGLPTAQQESIRTDETVILYGLNDWYAVVPTSSIGTWRNLRKGVIKMGNVRLGLFNQTTQSVISII